MSEISTLPETTAQSPRPVEKIDRVPLVQKLAWGIGGVTDNIMANSLNMLGQQIYILSLGLNPIWMLWALSIPRIWDAFIDPIIGNLSDNTRSRWGRRRPFIVFGAVLSAVTFAAVCMPPTALTQNALFWFFLIMSMAYYLGYAIFIIPRNALGIELSTDPAERTRVQVWNAFFGSVIGLGMPFMYKLATYLGKIFAAPGDAKPELTGIRYVGVIFGVAVLVSGFIPAIFCRERAEVQAQEKIPILPALKWTLCNYPFLLLSAAIVLILAGIFIADPFTLYIHMFHICRGNKDLYGTLYAYSGMFYAVMGLLALPLAPWLGARLGKKNTLLAAEALTVIGYLSTWIMFTPSHPWLMLIPPLIMCPGLTSIWILSASMMCEICDLDELKTGLRREGMFGAVFSLVFKAGLAAFTCLSGYIIIKAGIPKDIAQFTPTPQALTNLRVIYIAIPTILFGLAFLLTWMFPITEKKAREVRAILDARKKESAETAATAV